MKFIVDECTGPNVAHWLQTKSYQVFSVYDESPGISDRQILNKAYKEDYIIITNDKDFGELVFRKNLLHKGIILLRMKKETSENKIYLLSQILEYYAHLLENKFVVATEQNIRII
ncbi:MAG: DUF5615 family PIN-like protein [Bacteroidales bacterium]|nr:DUF5615 family PIN-like protein [Bacteroidales bacterium]